MSYYFTTTCRGGSCKRISATEQNTMHWEFYSSHSCTLGVTDSVALPIEVLHHRMELEVTKALTHRFSLAAFIGGSG